MQMMVQHNNRKLPQLHSATPSDFNTYYCNTKYQLGSILSPIHLANHSGWKYTPQERSWQLERRPRMAVDAAVFVCGRTCRCMPLQPKNMTLTDEAWLQILCSLWAVIRGSFTHLCYTCLCIWSMINFDLLFKQKSYFCCHMGLQDRDRDSGISRPRFWSSRLRPRPRLRGSTLRNGSQDVSKPRLKYRELQVWL